MGRVLPSDLLDTARNGVHANVCEPNAGICNEEIIPSSEGRLVPLQPRVIAFIRELRVQNIVRGTNHRADHVKTLLHYVLHVTWSKNAGYLWYDYDTEEFWAILEHPLGRDDGKVYEAKPLLNTTVDVWRIDDYDPHAIGFDVNWLHPHSWFTPRSLFSLPLGRLLPIFLWPSILMCPLV